MHGEEVARLRRETFERLAPIAAELAMRLADLPMELGYRTGWKDQTPLAEALRTSAERDRARASTHAGPHRADIDLRVGGRTARDVLSRGQQKLAAAALVLAGIEYLRNTHDLSPTLLLDDPAAELDSARLGAFAALVHGLNCQLLVTSLHSESGLFSRADAVFHVEQGRVKQV
jgi:DNA replication and repair protein RecF